MTLDMLEKIAGALDVSPQELLGEQKRLSSSKKDLQLFDEAIRRLKVLRGKIGMEEG